jgi:hypothetical protein
MPAAATRRIRARFTEVRPVASGDVVGVVLAFRPERSRIDVTVIEHFADLGPKWDLPAVGGTGSILRVLRAGRIVAPEAEELIGKPEQAAKLLERALGTAVSLELRRRSRIRFTVWTDEGVETIEHVRRVSESDDAFLVVRTPGLPPIRIDRERVVRQQKELERWWEVLDVERL